MLPRRRDAAPSRFGPFGHHLGDNRAGPCDYCTVRHARFDVVTLAVDRVEVLLKAAYLLVAETDDGVVPQWEILAYAVTDAPLNQQVYRVDVTTLDGRYFRGNAALVRSVEGSHVLRGAEALIGFDPDLDLHSD